MVLFKKIFIFQIHIFLNGKKNLRGSKLHRNNDILPQAVQFIFFKTLDFHYIELKSIIIIIIINVICNELSSQI
ncbi:hypothetical protein BpHYR1_001626 [Brachionus plicatilis]|uniref:Uncharacterized protein n=1 Tax=Brachionus plicatilis TaxID=10195 RepID=A0A3M7PLX1_BRAPC|nr:hypothetical protein BpHYR1_001626 [Brachionus plicatilis]